MKEKFVLNGDISIQYLLVNESKEDIPVIFIPGAMVSIDEIYNDLQEYFDFFTILINIRGLGKSSSPSKGYAKEHLISDIDSVIKAENIQKCFMVGHSFGASVASAFSVKNPFKIKGLILGDYPPYYPAYPPEWADNLLKNAPEINELLVNGLLKESKREKFTNALSKCSFKILILKGDTQYSALPIEFAEKINEALPNSTLKIIPGCGHEIFIENPKFCFEVIRKFIKE